MSRSMIVLAATLWLITGCVTERVIVHERGVPPSAGVVYREPPPIAQEVVSIAPSPVHIWIGGYWAWRAHNYAWVPGYWARPPRPHAAWVPGVWLRISGGWSWQAGHWRVN
jgi:WXXGXW repeat (2 copies)